MSTTGWSPILLVVLSVCFSTQWSLCEITLRHHNRSISRCLRSPRHNIYSNVACLPPHIRRLQGHLTICRDCNRPKSLPEDLEILLLIEDSDQELVHVQFCFDQIALQITLNCTFQFRGRGRVGTNVSISVGKLVIAYSKIIWIWATSRKSDCIKKKEKNR